jgi:uncharacterized protein YutD
MQKCMYEGVCAGGCTYLIIRLTREEREKESEEEREEKEKREEGVALGSSAWRGPAPRAPC